MGEPMKKARARIILVSLLASLLTALSGCTKSSQLDAEFRDLTQSVQSYCNLPSNQRSSGAKSALLDKLNGFEAELASQPEATRLRYRDRVANQRCFVETAR
jgi:hypothetical protein